MSQVATRLKEVREEKNFTIETVAEKSGIAIEELQAFEEGTKLPDASALMQLSKAYEMSIDRILYSGSEMPKYDESKAVYANVKPVAADIDDAQKENDKKADAISTSANKAGILTHLVFPVLCVIIYIFLGVAGGFWHPGWIIFLGIPLYYALVFITSRIGKNVDNAVKEYMEEEEKKQ